jgi:hypothetical protein
MKRILLSLCMLVGALALSAQVKYGARVGLNYTTFDIHDIRNNRASGWFLGPTCEYTTTSIGIGFDASLLFSRVNSDEEYADESFTTYRIDYLTLPVNVRYTLNLRNIQPFIYAGPELSARISDNFGGVWKALGQVTDVRHYYASGADLKFNIGGGIKISSHFELFVNYNVGTTNAVKEVESKSKTWRMGLAVYL